jgi:hypothetical protein
MCDHINFSRFCPRFISFIIVIFLFVCSANVQAKYDPNLSISDDTYLVNFAGETPDANIPNSSNHIFEITNKKTQQSNQFVIKYPSMPIADEDVKMHILKDSKLVIETKWKARPNGSTGLHIINMKDCTLIDQFFCYDPVLSPSERFWVYEKYYPPHGSQAIQTTVVLVYDMEKSPLENRLPVEGYTELPEEQVGLPVYPEPYVKVKKYMLLEEQENNPFWYTMSSPFLWSSDSNDVVFLCNHQKNTYCVRVNIGSGIELPKIFSSPPIDVSSYLKAGLTDAVIKSEIARLKTINAEQIVWADKKHIIINPDKVAFYNLEETIILPIP